MERVPNIKPNGEDKTPISEEALAMWTPERFAKAVMKEGIAAAGRLATDTGKTNRDPIARLGMLGLLVLGALAWVSHEVGSSGFKEAMDATNEATYIMIGVICEAHPEAAGTCRTAERKLNR